MKNKLLLIFILLSYFSLQAGTLNKIRSNAESKNHRVVFDLVGLTSYKIDKQNNQVTITIFDCKIPKIKTAVGSYFIQNFKVEQNGTTAKISFNIPKVAKAKTFKMDQPDRIVLDVSSVFAQPNNTTNQNDVKKEQTAEIKNPKTEKSITPEPTKALEKATLSTIQDAWSAGELDKVITLSSTIIKERPTVLLPYLYRAQAYHEKGRQEKNKAQQKKLYNNAVQDYNKVVMDSLSYVDGHAKMAELYKVLGEDAKAEEHYALFMNNYQDKSDSDSSVKPQAAAIIPKDHNQAVEDSTAGKSLGMNSFSNLLIYGGIIFLVVALISLIFIRRRMSEKAEEEVDDSSSNEPDKDDLFEKLRPKSFIDNASNKEVDVGLSRKSFVNNESSTADIKQTPQKLNVANTEQELLDKIVNSKSVDDDLVSITLDEDIRDRIIELYDDGYTNREIAEQLKISYDEVNFIIRSLGEADNEAKNKNKDIINSSAGGITDSQNEETMQMKEIQDLYKQGVSIEELGTYFKKPQDEIEFIISLIPGSVEKQVSKQSQSFSSQSFDTQEEDKLTNKIKELAESGLTRKQIAEELKIGLDEVAFAAAMFKIEFAEEPESSISESSHANSNINHESVVDWTKASDSTPPEEDLKFQPLNQAEPFAVNETPELPEEPEEAMMISNALEFERKQESAEFSDVIPVEKDIVDDIINEEPEEEFDYQPQSNSEPEREKQVAADVEQEIIPKISRSESKIITRDDIGIDLDKLLASQSIAQDYGVAESRIFDFKKDEFKDVFAGLPSLEEEYSTTDMSDIELEMKQLDNSKLNRRDEVDEDDHFIKTSALRKQLAGEMKLERRVQNEEIENKFDEVDALLENKLNSQKKNSSPVALYNERELSQSFESIINDYDSEELTESTVLSDKDDDDLTMMRKVYQMLDDGMEVAQIARDLETSVDDVMIYKKIKDGGI